MNDFIKKFLKRMKMNMGKARNCKMEKCRYFCCKIVL